MTTTEYNRLISLTVELGNGLIFESMDDEAFELFRSSIKRIEANGYKLHQNRVRLKTCHIMGTLTVESFRLSRIQQFFFSDGDGTYGHVTAKNTEEQIKKRYVLKMISYLPILKVA